MGRRRKFWIKGALADRKPGALKRQLDIPAGQKIPTGVLRNVVKTEIGKMARIDGLKKVTPLLKRRASLALTLRRFRKKK